MLEDTAKRKFYDVVLLSFNYSMSHDSMVFEAMKKVNEAGIGFGCHENTVPVASRVSELKTLYCLNPDFSISLKSAN